MGNIKDYAPVKIFTAITYSSVVLPDELLKHLQNYLSPLHLKSSVYSFSDFTDYYQPEMGSDLSKQIISFHELKPAEFLPEIKIFSNQIESNFAKQGKRTVNIDPGYLCAAKVVLATTKDYDHRIYLNRGIFGDVHLRYRNGQFQVNEWTYPDYQQPAIIEFFENLRVEYLTQLSQWKIK